MPNSYRGTTQYSVMYTELIRAARYRGTVTYQELADLINLPLTGNFMAAELGEYLGAISQDEVNQGRPMLSAIAVNSQGKPSKGFFDWAQQLGRFIGGDATTQDAFWKREKEAVYKTWQRSFDKPS